MRRDGPGRHGDSTTIRPSPLTRSPSTQAPLPDLVVSSITPPSNGVLSGDLGADQLRGDEPGDGPNVGPGLAGLGDPVAGPDARPKLPTASNQQRPGNDQTLNNQPVIVGFDNPSYLERRPELPADGERNLPITAQGTWYVYVVPDGTGESSPVRHAGDQPDRQARR